jgi:hypothetical protein
VTMTRNVPPDMLARVSSYDVLGTVMAMPVGALVAGPLGAAIGVSRAQYAAAALIVAASALALIPRDIRTFRNDPPQAAVLEGPAVLEEAAAGAAGAQLAPAAAPLSAAQTFLAYERNVSTDTATHTTASTSRPPQRTPIAPQSGAVETAERPI